MNPKSASTLVWHSFILVLLGIFVLNPAARFMFFVMGAISAAVPTMFSRTRSCIVGSVALLASLVLATMSYPSAERHMRRYRERAQMQSDRGGTAPRLRNEIGILFNNVDA